MNINAKEFLLLNKNIKFRGEAESTPTTKVEVTEPAVSNPQTGLDALEAQGQNNVSFQGVKLAALKKQALNSMMALTVLASAASLTSCDDGDTYTTITPESNGGNSIVNNITIDFSQLIAVQQAMLVLWQDMIEQQKLTNEQMILMNTNMALLLEQVKSGQISAEEFYNKMYDFMLNSEVNQKAIISLMTQNGKTEEEAVKFIKELLAEVKSGKLDAAEAYEKLMQALGKIDSSITQLISEIKNLSVQMAENHKEYINAKEEELEILGDIYYQGEIRNEYLEMLNQKADDMSKKLDALKADTKVLVDIFSDDQKFNQLIETIKNTQAGSVDYERFEAMFKMLGLSISDVVAGNREELQATLKNFQLNYIANEEKEAALLAEISNKLGILSQFPGLDTGNLEELLAGLKDSVDMNTGAITEIATKLDAIEATLNSILKEVTELSDEFTTYNQLYAKNWTEALGKLDNLIGDVKDIKAEQKVSNTALANIEANTDALVDAQNVANVYLKELLEKADELKDAIAELEVAGGNGGMTIDEFKAFMLERDEAQYNKIVKFIEDNGFDKLPGDVATIKDLLGAINDKVQEQKDYSNQLNTIIAKLDDMAAWLKNADFSNPDYSAKLDKIIDLLTNFKCNCECGGNSDVNEGITGGFGDIFG